MAQINTIHSKSYAVLLGTEDATFPYFRRAVQKGYQELSRTERCQFYGEVIAHHAFPDSESAEKRSLMFRHAMACSGAGERLSSLEQQQLTDALRGRTWSQLLDEIPEAIDFLSKSVGAIVVPDTDVNRINRSQRYFSCARGLYELTLSELQGHISLKITPPSPPQLATFSSRDEAKRYLFGLQDLEASLLSLLPPDMQVLDVAAAKGEFSSLSSARSCVRDVVRTWKFASAISAAVKQQRQMKPDRELLVIDAGCGALPVLSIAALCADPSLKVQALDCNPLSLRIAAEVISTLGFNNRVEFIHCDATSFTPASKVDLLVSETMYTGLRDEPIAQILNHLSKYVQDDGVCIPQRVDLYYGIYPAAQYDNFTSFTCMGQNTYSLLLREEQLIKFCSFYPHKILNSINVEVPLGAFEHLGQSYFFLGSAVELFPGYRLLPEESVITAAVPLPLEGEESMAFLPLDGGRLVLAFPPGGWAELRFEREKE